MRRFSLYLRGRTWYVQFFNEKTNKWDSARSTGQTDENEARLVVSAWRKNGIPQKGGISRPLAEVENFSSVLYSLKTLPLSETETEKIVNVLRERKLVETVVLKSGPGSEELISFLCKFWNYDESKYVRQKKSRGRRIGRRHCWDMEKAVKCYWKPFFKGKHLSGIRESDIEDFILFLSEKRGLSPKTINNVLNAGTVPFKWAHKKKIIPMNPATGLETFSGDPRKKRNVLKPEEAERLFTIPWEDDHARLGNLLAAVSGLRAGEVIGLQVRDIADDRLYIRHSFSYREGLKCPKNGEERSIPLRFPSLRKALLDLARQNPHGVGPTSFVFWSFKAPDQPMDRKRLNIALYKTLKQLNPHENWKLRNIVFHSWRHFFAARISDELDQAKAMSATGHKDASIFKAYADHITENVFQEVGNTIVKTFKDIVSGGIQ